MNDLTLLGISEVDRETVHALMESPTTWRDMPEGELETDAIVRLTRAGWMRLRVRLSASLQFFNYKKQSVGIFTISGSFEQTLHQLGNECLFRGWYWTVPERFFVDHLQYRITSAGEQARKILSLDRDGLTTPPGELTLFSIYILRLFDKRSDSRPFVHPEVRQEINDARTEPQHTGNVDGTGDLILELLRKIEADQVTAPEMLAIFQRVVDAQKLATPVAKPNWLNPEWCIKGLSGTDATRLICHNPNLSKRNNEVLNYVEGKVTYFDETTNAGRKGDLYFKNAIQFDRASTLWNKMNPETDENGS